MFTLRISEKFPLFLSGHNSRLLQLFDCVLFLLQVEEVEVVDKKGYLTLCITLAKDGKVLLRKPEGIRDWFQDIKVRETKGRGGAAFPSYTQYGL